MRIQIFLCVCAIAGPLAAAQTLLVVNQGDSTVSLLRPGSGAVMASIPENTPGVHAHEITASADGRTAYLPIYGSVGVGKPGISGHEMLILDVPAAKVIGHIDFGHPVRPHLPVLDPVSGMLYITTELDNSVTIVNPKTNTIVGAIPTGEPESHMLAISHDGKRGYTANVGSGTVSVLDLPGRKTIAVLHVAPVVQRISISNDDRWVFTSDQSQPRLAVIDTTTNQVKTWVPLPARGYGSASTRDGQKLLLAVPLAKKVVVIDLATFEIVHTLDVPGLPEEVLVPPTGDVAYVSTTSGKVATIDLKKWTVKDVFTAGPGADGLGWAR